MSESEIQIWTVEKPYIELDCQLGEGPFYEEETRTLRFVDIFGKKLHRFHVDKGQSSLESYDTGDAIGVTFDIEGDETHAIAAAKYGFALMDRQTGKLSYLASPYSNDDVKSERMRFNDGSIDPRGRLLAGAMTDPALHKIEREGALFRLVPSGADSSYTVSTVVSPVAIPNGIGWTADGRTMLHTDSPTYTILAYRYDPETATASSPRPWFVMQHHAGATDFKDSSIPEDAGPEGCEPDGFAVDEGGDIWTAVYGAGKVLRLREDASGTAKVIGVVKLPASKITCPRFVDEDLIITSAEKGGDFGGCVFRVHVGVRGVPAPKWKKHA